MNKTLEKLWRECFAEECAAIDSEEEKAIIKKAGEIHSAVNEALTKEQSKVNEAYIEALYKMQQIFVKKAFFKGYELAISMLFGAVSS